MSVKGIVFESSLILNEQLSKQLNLSVWTTDGKGTLFFADKATARIIHCISFEPIFKHQELSFSFSGDQKWGLLVYYNNSLFAFPVQSRQVSCSDENNSNFEKFETCSFQYCVCIDLKFGYNYCYKRVNALVLYISGMVPPAQNFGHVLSKNLLFIIQNVQRDDNNYDYLMQRSSTSNAFPMLCYTIDLSTTQARELKIGNCNYNSGTCDDCDYDRFSYSYGKFPYASVEQAIIVDKCKLVVRYCQYDRDFKNEVLSTYFINLSQMKRGSKERLRWELCGKKILSQLDGERVCRYFYNLDVTNSSKYVLSYQSINSSQDHVRKHKTDCLGFKFHDNKQDDTDTKKRTTVRSTTRHTIKSKRTSNSIDENKKKRQKGSYMSSSAYEIVLSTHKTKNEWLKSSQFCFMFFTGKNIVVMKSDCDVYTCFVSRFIGQVSLLGSTSDGLDAKYQMVTKIGSGGTASVYNGRVYDRIEKYTLCQTNKEIVIKQQNINVLINSNEKYVHDQLGLMKLDNISCKMFDYFESHDCKYYVFEKLGASLQHLLMENNNKFDLNTVLTIFDQMIVILYRLHMIGFVHNDIKPENVLVGNNTKDIETLHLIDFGISKLYWNHENNTHVSLEEDEKIGFEHFEGTFRFASKNHHCLGLRQSRRDDLESLLYMCIFCLKGSLPWMINYNQYKNDKDKENRLPTKEEMFEISKRIKNKSSIDEICKHIPKEFEIGLKYVRELKYNQMPDYVFLQNIFHSLHCKLMPMSIDWNVFGDGHDNDTKNPNLMRFIGARVQKSSFKKSNNTIQIDEKEQDQIIVSNAEEEAQLMKLILRPDGHNETTMADTWQSNWKTKVTSERIINKYNKLLKNKNDLYKHNATLTNGLFQTHMTIYNRKPNLRNRSGYIIDSLAIGAGVPKNRKELSFADYSGIIIYGVVGDGEDKNLVRGTIYMLDTKKCCQINQKYKQSTENTSQLVGVIHGAVYYYYFEKNIHLSVNKTFLQDEYGHEKSLIRGFSITSNGEFIFRSGAFNVNNFQLFDSKYKDLAQCEKLFIQFFIQNYWKNSTRSMKFDEYQTKVNKKKLKQQNTPNHKYEHKDTDKEPTCIKQDADEKCPIELIPSYDISNSILNNEYPCLLVNVSLPLMIISNILECLNIQDEVSLYQTSTKAQKVINQHHLSRDGQMYLYVVQGISHSNCNLNIVGIKQISDGEIAKLNVNLTNLTCTVENKISNDNCQTIDEYQCELIKFILPRNHPMLYWACNAHAIIKKDCIVSHRFVLKKWLIHSAMTLINDVKNSSSNKRQLKIMDDVHQIPTTRLRVKYILADEFYQDDSINIADARNNCKASKLTEMEAQWSWNYGHGIWYNFDTHINKQIELSFVRGETCVTIKSKQKKTGISMEYKIWFEKESENISQQIDTNDEFQNITNCAFRDGFTKYMFQEAVETKKLRVVKRIDCTNFYRFVVRVVDDSYFMHI